MASQIRQGFAPWCESRGAASYKIPTDTKYIKQFSFLACIYWAIWSSGWEHFAC